MKGTGDIAEGNVHKFHGKWYYCGKNGQNKEECCKRAAELAAKALDEQQDNHVEADEEDNESYDELGFMTEDR